MSGAASEIYIAAQLQDRKMHRLNDAPARGAMAVQEFIDWAGIGRTKVYELIGSGELRAIKVGRRTLIRVEEAKRWLDAQPEVGSFRR